MVLRGDPDGGAAPLSFATVLAGLSYALDLTEGQRPGHAVRSCLIGMRIARTLDLPTDQRQALFHALLMKDLGCSSNSARFAALFGSNDHDLKMDLASIDWSRALGAFQFVLRNSAPGQFWLKRAWRVLAVVSRGAEGAREVVRTRCERGAEIARLLGLPEATADAIRALDEHWDGRGQPYSKMGEEIPILGRVLNLAQTVEVFFTAHGAPAAYDMAAARRGTWFDPTLVDALFSMRPDDPFWHELGSGHVIHMLAVVQPGDCTLPASDDQLDTVAEAFAKVVDAKSPWTYAHSHGVAALAVEIGRLLGYAPAELRELRRAALLHDLGKLGVSNLILDKPGPLTGAELAAMRQHPYHTAQILQRVSCFSRLAAVAAAHHERPDGRGYHLGLEGEGLTQHARVLCVADICDALRASRPYRPGLAYERVLEIMSREVGDGIDPACFSALRSVWTTAAAKADVDVPAARIVSTLAEDYHQAA